MTRKDKAFIIVLFILCISSVFNIIIFYRSNDISNNKTIIDTTYNKVTLDSIEYNIVKRDSIIYNLKEEYEKEIEQNYNSSDSDAIALFYKLVSDK